MPRSILADLEQLRRHIAPHVRRARTVIAFGSVARGNADDRSDLDLIIVADTAAPSSSASRTSGDCTTSGHASTS
jgi:predicted nucleotidyltransferase